MIKGEVEEITLNMNIKEAESLMTQSITSKTINLMGQKYMATSLSYCEYGRFQGEYRARITIRVEKIKTGN